MTPEERQLITGLFDRMRGFNLPEKDGEAEALISERVRAVPDAPYMLVQSVLIQEQALEEAGSRIKALEEQVRAQQGGAQERAAGSGSFLGGLFGGGRTASEPPRGASVPVVGARSTPSAYDSRQPWTPLQGGPQQAAPTAQAAAAPGGSFLRTAMATAAGVAGGMLVAGAIRDLMGSSAHANPAATTPAAATPAPDASAAAASETARPAQEQPQDVADDDGGWFGGDSGDFEI